MSYSWKHILTTTLSILTISSVVYAKVRAPEVYAVDEPLSQEIVITQKEQNAVKQLTQPATKGLPGATTGSHRNTQKLQVLGKENQVPVYPAPATPYVQSESFTSLPAYKSQLPAGEFAPDFWTRPRSLFIYNNRTKEQATVTYWANGQLIPSGYWELCRLLRDDREQLMAAMDPRLFDILYGIQGYYHAWKYFKPIEILSGYRSPKTNAMLQSEGAAKASLHMQGKAVDIRIANVSQQNIGNLARYFNQGGVGFYPGSNFTHVDTGPIRTWTR